jgi:hypothetical protein
MLMLINARFKILFQKACINIYNVHRNKQNDGYIREKYVVTEYKLFLK